MVRDVAIVRLGFVYSICVQQRGVEDMQMVDDHWFFNRIHAFRMDMGGMRRSVPFKLTLNGDIKEILHLRSSTYGIGPTGGDRGRAEPQRGRGWLGVGWCIHSRLLLGVLFFYLDITVQPRFTPVCLPFLHTSTYRHPPESLPLFCRLPHPLLTLPVFG